MRTMHLATKAGGEASRTKRYCQRSVAAADGRARPAVIRGSGGRERASTGKRGFEQV
jgi:hypothetical protein